MPGRYRVTSELGAGGMGTVYRAHDTRLNRDVAIKVLPPQALADERARSMFRDEAHALARLNHPHIGAIYDFESEEGADLLVMELVAGEPLAARIGGQPLPEVDVLNLGVQIASALEHAHAHGIVHRDLKPANILVRPDGQAKVLDFGLARLLRPPPESDLTATATVTEPQTLAGTLPYMAPEQFRMQPADARTDVWALGVVLYEMAAGIRPFRGASGFELSAAILSERPAPLPVRVAAPLRTVIERCLEKNPAQRYQTAGEVRAALEAIRAGTTAAVAGPSPPAVRRGWLWVSAAAVLTVLIVAAFVWQMWRTPSDPSSPLRAVPLAALPGVARYPSLSPDGGQLAFSWNGHKGGNSAIYVQQIGSGSPLRLTQDPAGDYNPVWSPDGRWIAFLRGEPARSELRLIPPLGGRERLLTDIRIREPLVTPPYLTWCPDSSCLIVTDSVGEGKPVALVAVNAETGAKRQLTHPQPPATGDMTPAVSPDGRWLVFRRNSTGYFSGELYGMPLGSGVVPAGNPRRLTEASLDANFPAWLPNGREILFCAKGSLWRLDVSGDPKPRLVPYVGEDSLMPVVSRPQGGGPSRLVYVRSFADYNILRVEMTAAGVPPTASPQVAVTTARYEGMAHLSPDGRQLAFSSNRGGSGEWEIWLSAVDGSSPVALTSLRSVSGAPRWSRDGQWIAFHSNSEGQWDAFVIPARGGKPRNVSSDPALDSLPSFSGDGTWIYFSSNRGGARRQLWKVPVAGGVPARVADATVERATESPDGAHIYFVENLSAASTLWRVPTSGGTVEKVLDGVYRGNFVVLQRGVLYLDTVSRNLDIYLVDRPGENRLRYFDFATRKSATVIPNLGIGDALSLTSSVDGRTIFYSRMDVSLDELMLVENFR